MGIACLLQIYCWNAGNKIPYLARIVLIQNESEASKVLNYAASTIIILIPRE